MKGIQKEIFHMKICNSKEGRRIVVVGNERRKIPGRNYAHELNVVMALRLDCVRHCCRCFTHLTIGGVVGVAILLDEGPGP